jgi:hypothetical protein
MRSTATLAARATKLEDAGVQHQRRGVLVLPKVLPLDVWEQVAMRHQSRLVEEAADERPPAAPVPAERPWWDKS